MPNTSTHQDVISISRSYHDAVEIYKSSFTSLLFVTLITRVLTYALLFSLGISALTSIFTIDRVSQFFSFNNPYTYIMALLLIMVGAIQLLGFIALLYITVQRKNPITVFGAFQHALHYIGRFILLSLIVAGAIFLGLLIGYVIVTLISIGIRFFSADMLDRIFPWLNIIPIITSAIASTLFIFGNMSMIEQDSSVRNALRHSYTMTRRYFWPTAIRLLLFYMVLTILSIVLSLIPYVGGFIFLVLSTPFSAIYIYTLYTDLKRLETTA